MRKKVLILSLMVVSLLVMVVPTVFADTTVEFEGNDGGISITSANGDSFDVFEIAGGYFAGWQLVDGGSMYIERQAVFDGEGFLATYSESNDAYIETHAEGESGYLDQQAPLHGYYHGANFADDLLSYNDFVIGASGSSDYGVYVGIYFDDNDAWFAMGFEGDGQGELRGISLMAQDRWGYNWVYGGNNKAWQPISGSATGTGEVGIGAYGEIGLEFDFDWSDDGTSGNTLLDVDDEGTISQWGDFDDSYDFAGIVRAYEDKNP